MGWTVTTEMVTLFPGTRFLTLVGDVRPFPFPCLRRGFQGPLGIETVTELKSWRREFSTFYYLHSTKFGDSIPFNNVVVIFRLRRSEGWMSFLTVINILVMTQSYNQTDCFYFYCYRIYSTSKWREYIFRFDYPPRFKEKRDAPRCPWVRGE